jgi:hypothetical protein
MRLVRMQEKAPFLRPSYVRPAFAFAFGRTLRPLLLTLFPSLTRGASGAVARQAPRTLERAVQKIGRSTAVGRYGELGDFQEAPS